LHCVVVLRRAAHLEGHVQKITDEALQQIDTKMTTLVH
jgi:hypothetical protein